MAVAVSFFAIAPDTGNEALRDLLGGDHAGTSSLGIAVTAASLQVMPGLGLTNKRLGAALNSGATAGEGVQMLSAPLEPLQC
jgi:divalent metal cation (Fe/Co/Zn/Cd) transporter